MEIPRQQQQNRRSIFREQQKKSFEELMPSDKYDELISRLRELRIVIDPKCTRNGCSNNDRPLNWTKIKNKRSGVMEDKWNCPGNYLNGAGNRARCN